MNSSHSSSSKTSRAGLTIFLAGLIAGILDLSFALFSFGKTLPVLLQTIAGGFLGQAAFQGGNGAVALGLACHFVISFGAAAVYYGLSRILPLLNRHVLPAGLIYGLLVYEFMHLVVLPLSAYHRPVAWPPLFVPDVFSHLVFVGLVIALVVRSLAEKVRPAAVA